MVFDTLALADDGLEAFYDDDYALREYSRVLGRVVIVAEGFDASVLQTWRSEQRAKPPAEGGETVASVEEGIVREEKESVHTQDIYSVIGSNGNLNAGWGPAKFDSCGAVKHAVRGAQKDQLGGAQPVGKQQTGAQVEEGRGFRPDSEWEAVFGVGCANEICARGRSGIGCYATRCAPGRYRPRA